MRRASAAAAYNVRGLDFSILMTVLPTHQCIHRAKVPAGKTFWGPGKQKGKLNPSAPAMRYEKQEQVVSNEHCSRQTCFPRWPLIGYRRWCLRRHILRCRHSSRPPLKEECCCQPPKGSEGDALYRAKAGAPLRWPAFPPKHWRRQGSWEKAASALPLRKASARSCRHPAHHAVSLSGPSQLC